MVPAGRSSDVSVVGFWEQAEFFSWWWNARRPAVELSMRSGLLMDSDSSIQVLSGNTTTIIRIRYALRWGRDPNPVRSARRESSRSLDGIVSSDFVRRWDDVPGCISCVGPSIRERGGNQ